ncbi:MAG: phosphatidylserine/phosphatidylglycerophosphate/cardiolipin synthase family protein [Myxococcales bacterium]|nr:phosphatidylserine/phosphatidylglycerophosphate/cardiolipin synthase family protein [Myxococcales bacterium]
MTDQPAYKDPAAVPHGLATTQVDGHDITLLRDGETVFPAMLADIAQAKREVSLEMYWTGNDAVGRVFRGALTAAARRGCLVRVVCDAFGSLELPAGFWDELLAAGGQVSPFHSSAEPAGAPLWRSLVSRDHRKVLCVDRRIVYVGGLNLAAPWLPHSQGGAAWRDTALRLYGSEAAAAAAGLFDQTWKYLRELPAIHGARPIATVGPRLVLLANHPQHRSGRVIRRMYLWAIRRAQHSIDITAAYFAPRLLFVQALLRAHRSGVRVRILLPLHSDVFLANVVAAPAIRYLLKHGISVYAYQNGFLHAKTAVVDSRWVTVGSHNLDALSWAFNLECNVAIDDRKLGQAMDRSFEEDLAASVQLSSAPKPAGLVDRAREIGGKLLLAGYRWL